MGLDCEILALFLFEPAVGPALAVEGIEVVDIELRIGEGCCKVTAA